eukprot:TRINITY_DN77058_c0_g1_i1.p1 TRINITY_DN77058_c0_g1~~TRINITY_DN77058_c0_g1_i1.p1  ORF type:complete len:290 (-),score=15.99 TRINITY_DN77058_c0_g1_i1:78-947(-)
MAPLDPFYGRHVAVSHDAVMKPPFWGPSTSHVDWCEQNYARSLYIAEFWNTLSSIPLVAACVYGLWKCHKYGIEWRFRACYIGMGVVGLGSVAFHGTMTHVGQASDEIAMIYASLIFLHAVLEIEQSERSWSAMKAPIVETVYAVLFTVCYFKFPEAFAGFVCAYIGCIAILLRQTCQAYSTYVSDVSEAGAWQRWLFHGSYGTYALGFLLLWVPENSLCPLWPEAMQYLQLHAWFHLLSAVAPYNFIIFITFHRLRVLRRRPEHRLDAHIVVYVHVPIPAPGEEAKDD